MSVTNPDKVVTKQDLADFYSEIMPYLGGNLPVLGTINKSDIFSTTERVVGCWVDGKPIYQKTVLILGGLPNKSSVIYDMGIRNVDTVVDIEGNYNRSTYGGVIINAGEKSNATDYTIRTYYDKSSDRILIFTGYDGSGDVGYITMRYTKTTDAANSFNYASENDYSTSEKIIGTWIGGEKIYKKTISFGALPNATTKSVAHGISNLGTIIGWEITDSNKYYIPYSSGKSSSTDYTTEVYATATNIVIKTYANWSGSTAYVTIKYTKTS